MHAVSCHVIIEAWHYLLLHFLTLAQNPYHRFPFLLQACLRVCHDVTEYSNRKIKSHRRTSYSNISGKSIIIWSDTTAHVYSIRFRYDITDDHWSQSSGFHLIWNIFVFFSGLWDILRYCCIPANAIAILMSGHRLRVYWWHFFSSVILLILINQYDMCLILVFFSSLMKEMYGEMIFLKELLIKNYHLQVHVLSL